MRLIRGEVGAQREQEPGDAAFQSIVGLDDAFDLGEDLLVASDVLLEELRESLAFAGEGDLQALSLFRVGRIDVPQLLQLARRELQPLSQHAGDVSRLARFRGLPRLPGLRHTEAEQGAEQGEDQGAARSDGPHGKSSVTSGWVSSATVRTSSTGDARASAWSPSVWSTSSERSTTGVRSGFQARAVP